MLPRNLDGVRESAAQAIWEELGQGIPTLTAFAELASRAIANPSTNSVELGREAKALLIASRPRGVFELRSNTEAFQSSDRMLAVCVEVDDQQYQVFKQTAEPRRTAEFLEGFRQLCAAGMVLHQAHREFALTARGFAEAAALDASDFGPELSYGQADES